VAEASNILKPVVRGQATLMNLLACGTVEIAPLDRDDIPRVRELMAKYQDLPMDLADAAIVRVAERQRIHRVFTTDHRDFQIDRPAHVRHLILLPLAISPA
jgi:predicted nucleic acid-binding protein